MSEKDKKEALEQLDYLNGMIDHRGNRPIRLVYAYETIKKYIENCGKGKK